ncbi:MAG: hypothetical protein GY794_14695 [bacterium]|nr:hypothetical protein [bacterium]
MKGKEFYNATLQTAVELDEYISKAISSAYRDTSLICNPVLSRNPFSSPFLLHASEQSQEPASGAGLWTVVRKMAMYFIRSFVGLFFLFLCYLTFVFSKLKRSRRRIDRDEELIVVDTYTIVEKIYQGGKFEDAFFGSLYDILDRRDKQSVILCFLEAYNPRNLRQRLAAYNILAGDGRRFVTEFELLGLRQWLALIRFVMVYPFTVMRLAKKTFGQFDQLFRQELIDALDTPQLFNYVGYLAGRQLGSLTDRKLTVIAWCENQVIDKLLYRGVRDSGCDATIYGCQFFTKPFLWRNLHPLEQEASCDVLPDVILVSGKDYLSSDTDSKLDMRLGMSPRYNYLFDIQPDRKSVTDRRGLSVLLPYDMVHSRSIITCVAQYAPGEPVGVKLHPNHELLQPFEYPDTWKQTTDHLSKVCSESRIVVTAGSGTALEAAIMGCSVIIVGKPAGLTFHPMPQYGKGKLWDLVFDPDELAQAAERLVQYRQDHPGEIITLATQLRDMFFTQATDDRFVQLFDL